MSATALIRVRVLPERSLSLNAGEGLAARSTLYGPGDELELPAADAHQLTEDGFVEAAV